MKKITYILSNIDKAVAFEWIAEHIDSSQYQISFILLNNQQPFLYQWLKNKNIEVYFLPHFGKKSFLKNSTAIYRLLKTIRPGSVHCHLLDANLLGLSAAKLAGIPQRIYTRHHSTFHHTYHPQAVKYDQWSNYLSTDIVAISENVKSVLIEKEHVYPQKIHLIHHGFDLKKFEPINLTENTINTLRKKHNIPHNKHPYIGIIARYINLKGHKYIFEAFKQLLNDYPNAHLILANANGPDKSEIKKLLDTIPNENYTEIVFEPDLFSLYQLFDVYVHTPINNTIEAFGQTYVEALAAGIPSVFTLSGVANEFIKNNNNALVVDFKNSKQIYEAVKTILENPDLTQQLIENGKKSVKSFDLKFFIKKLEALYQ